MYPDVDIVGSITSINKSERDFYFLIKNSPDTKNWTVFYSSVLKYKNKTSEVDFIVFIPDEGIVLIELKANNPVSVTPFEFKYNYNHGEITQENPFRKIKNIIPEFKTMLNLTEEEKNKIFIHYMVIFINFNGEFDEDVCFSRSNYINARIELKNIPSMIITKFNRKKNIESKNRIGVNASSDDINRIMDKIKSNLLNTRNLRIESSNINFENAEADSKSMLLNFYTMISNFKRLFIEGPAGSGKTFFALQYMLSHNADYTISYICNSRMLYEKMRYSFQNVNRVDMATYNNLLTLKKEKYDILILDEFENYKNDIMIFDDVVKNGINYGNVLIMYDLEIKNLEIDSFLKKHNFDKFYVKLKSNFRNNVAICEFINNLYDRNIYDNFFLNYYSQINIIKFSNNDIDTVFGSTIEELVEKEKYFYSDIKVITSKPFESSHAFSKILNRKKWIRDLDFVTIDDFMGLDSKVVVFIVDDGSYYIENILYKGATRAKQRLVILLKDTLYGRFKNV